MGRVAITSGNPSGSSTMILASLLLLFTASSFLVPKAQSVFTFVQPISSSSQDGNERFSMDNVPEIKEEKKRAFTSFMLRNRNNRDYEKAIEQMKSMGLLPVMEAKKRAWGTKR